eukprot:2526851-Prymnesium_polylepis.1
MLHMYTNEWNDIGHEGVHTDTSSSRTPTRRSARCKTRRVPRSMRSCARPASTCTCSTGWRTCGTR